MQSILVTGGSGFIGSHTCYSLLKEGHDIFVIDSLTNSSEKSLERVILLLKEREINIHRKLHFIKGDIKNPREIEKIFQKALKIGKAIKAVIHFLV
tara:strand:- start:134 stop:421 length:288 start_codon:yes stop_codon:yes gene_type:complete